MSAPVTKKTKMSELLNYRLNVSTLDRSFIGNLLAFDKHMNLVLADCEEVRIPKKTMKDLKQGGEMKELKRSLGLIILRGEQVVNVVIQNPPATGLKKRIGKGGSRPLAKMARGKFKGFKP